MIAGPAKATTAKGITGGMRVNMECDTIYTNKLINCTNTLQD